jgi:hypothetical protein
MNSRRPTPNRVRFLGHDAFLIRGVVGWPFLLEGGRAILEELLLPAVEDRGLQAEFIAEFRDRLLLKQMPPQDGDLLLRASFRCFFMRSLLYLTGRTPSPFPTEPEQIFSSGETSL